MATTIERAREAYDRRAWREAYDLLAAGEALGADDLERLAVAAYLVGLDDESAQAWERAHLECVRQDDPDRAARCAFWLALAFLLGGETAHAGGWLARAGRLVEDAGDGTLAAGYLAVPAAVGALAAGDAAAARDHAARAAAVAARFADADLMAFALLGKGQAAIALGEVAAGLALLDEVMVGVTTGEVGPIGAGIVYCAVIQECMAAFDLRRAAEWTEALTRWCDAQPDLVPYRGQCLVHRSQVLLARGAWPAAAEQADQARARLSDPPHPAIGVAHYQRGELHRLRGEFEQAEEAYRAASRGGVEPVPGLALLRLAEGRVHDAVGTVRRMVDEAHDRSVRPTVLAACVEIHLRAGEVAAARAAADELRKVAADLDAPLVHALADQAAAAVLLAEGDAGAALAAAKRAGLVWRSLEMPYEGARAQVLAGLACRALGDGDAADLQLDAARAAFVDLGAGPDLARLDEVSARRPASPLTARECDVLRLVAAGRTNREVAAALVISEHTVARHVQNIFAKLGLSSRAAATAYAYEHGLV